MLIIILFEEKAVKSTKTKKEIISFWDEHFTNAQAMSITKDDITLDTPLDECLQFLGDNCDKVLDIAWYGEWDSNPQGVNH